MPENRKRIVIIGATSAIAEHCARLWVKEEAVDLTLVGRDLAKTTRVAADLRVRSPHSHIVVQQGNFCDTVEVQRIVDDIVAAGGPHIVLIAHGSLPDQAACQQDLSAVSDAMLVNGISPLLFAEAFAGNMEKANCGTLAIIGSVAGDRGRKSNYIYGAAKGMVARYAQGLQHRTANTAVKVVLIKPGPTNTPMTAHLRQQGRPLAKVEDVAKIIVKGIAGGRPLIYAPGKWALIMMVIRHLPDFIFRRMDI